jgi:drug/metabolite transporter (DMT)-like permease
LLWKTFGFGLMGFYLASFFDFLGLQYLSAGMERIVLFLYPTLVLLLSALFLGKRIEPIQVGAVVLSYAGVAIAFLGMEAGAMTPSFYLGGGLVFLSALTYAIYLMGTGELVPQLGTFRFTAYAMLAATVGVLAQQLVWNGFDLFAFHPLVYVYGALMGVFATVLPSFMFSEGIRRIGSSNAAIISSIGPFSTIVLEYLFLEERFGGWQWLGAVFVVSGVLLISLSKNKRSVA